MREVSIIGAGMVKFGKYIDTSMKVLARDAVQNAMGNARVELLVFKRRWSATQWPA